MHVIFHIDSSLTHSQNSRGIDFFLQIITVMTLKPTKHLPSPLCDFSENQQFYFTRQNNRLCPGNECIVTVITPEKFIIKPASRAMETMPWPWVFCTLPPAGLLSAADTNRLTCETTPPPPKKKRSDESKLRQTSDSDGFQNRAGRRRSSSKTTDDSRACRPPSVLPCSLGRLCGSWHKHLHSRKRRRRFQRDPGTPIPRCVFLSVCSLSLSLCLSSSLSVCVSTIFETAKKHLCRRRRPQS